MLSIKSRLEFTQASVGLGVWGGCLQLWRSSLITVNHVTMELYAKAESFILG